MLLKVEIRQIADTNRPVDMQFERRCRLHLKRVQVGLRFQLAKFKGDDPWQTEEFLFDQWVGKLAEPGLLDGAHAILMWSHPSVPLVESLHVIGWNAQEPGRRLDCDDLAEEPETDFALWLRQPFLAKLMVKGSLDVIRVDENGKARQFFNGDAGLRRVRGICS